MAVHQRTGSSSHLQKGFTTTVRSAEGVHHGPHNRPPRSPVHPEGDPQGCLKNNVSERTGFISSQPFEQKLGQLTYQWLQPNVQAMCRFIPSHVATDTISMQTDCSRWRKMSHRCK
eukprot:9433060-Lingulodinium_polyedra.AAC.1